MKLISVYVGKPSQLEKEDRWTFTLTCLKEEGVNWSRLPAATQEGPYWMVTTQKLYRSPTFREDIGGLLVFNNTVNNTNKLNWNRCLQNRNLFPVQK